MEQRQAWGEVELSFGAVAVRSQVTSFLRRLPSGEVLGEHPLDLPERSLQTKAVWWTMPESLLAAAGVEPADIPGAAHAAEHAAIGMLPLVATCDRWDIGGVSTALHPDTGLPTIFVYDGHPGGAGFAERGFAAARDLARRHAGRDRGLRVRRPAARRACSHPSAATATSRWTSGEHMPCCRWCWPSRRADRLRQTPAGHDD